MTPPEMPIKGSRVTFGDLAEDKTFIADQETPVTELARVMVDHWIDSIFIVGDHGELLGIVTDGILLNLVANGENVKKLVAKDVMERHVYKVNQHDPILPYRKLKEGFSKRHNRVSRLAIVDEQDRLVGVFAMNILEKIGRFSRSFEITLKKKEHAQDQRDGDMTGGRNQSRSTDSK